MNKIKKRIAIAFFAPFAFALFIWIGGEVVMHLWNWLLPSLFGWKEITFWQAIGLLALCRILFGGMSHRGGNRSGFRRKMRDRWEGMTPEEREKFRQAYVSRCGVPPPPDSTPTPG
jgi:hypothetical protein